MSKLKNLLAAANESYQNMNESEDMVLSAICSALYKIGNIRNVTEIDSSMISANGKTLRISDIKFEDEYEGHKTYTFKVNGNKHMAYSITFDKNGKPVESDNTFTTVDNLIDNYKLNDTNESFVSMNERVLNMSKDLFLQRAAGRLASYAEVFGIPSSSSGNKVKLNGKTYTISDGGYTDDGATVMEIKIGRAWYRMWASGYGKDASESNTIVYFLKYI